MQNFETETSETLSNVHTTSLQVKTDTQELNTSMAPTTHVTPGTLETLETTTSEKVNVKFTSTVDEECESDSEIEDIPQLEDKPTIVKKIPDQPDLSKYTKVDNLHEDKPIVPKNRTEQPQVYFLVSFLSPEGIMNCNVRAFKVRGVFPTEEEAMEYAKEIEKEDIYFKIYCGEVGKWLDFDPPSNKVEREVSSNPNHQKFLNAQNKQRMETMNVLAGKHIEQMEKKEKGKKERIDESKKSGAASNAIDKIRSKKQKESETETETSEKKTDETKSKSNKSQVNPKDHARENIRNRLKQRLAKIQNKKQLENMKDDKTTYFQPDDIDTKTKVVNKASKNLEDTKNQLIDVDKNISAIKELMANRKTKTN